jgi:hypothetical protein
MQEKLLPEELCRELPKLYAQEKVETKEKQAYLKFFNKLQNSYIFHQRS